MKRLTIIIAVLAALFVAGCYDASDVRDACAGHGGVQDMENVAWDFSESGDAMLVACKDGTVKGLE